MSMKSSYFFGLFSIIDEKLKPIEGADTLTAESSSFFSPKASENAGAPAPESVDFLLVLRGRVNGLLSSLAVSKERLNG